MESKLICVSNAFLDAQLGKPSKAVATLSLDLEDQDAFPEK